MSHFSPEREEEIQFEIWDWWDDKDWDERVELVDPGGTGEFTRLLEFADETQKAHESCRVREAGQSRIVDKRRFDETKVILDALSQYLWDLAEMRGVIDEIRGEKLTWGC
jgi:hypothetical protein